MQKTIEIKELVLVIAANGYDPSLLNVSLLVSSGIISKDWKLSQQPVLSNRVSQIVFDNGVSLLAQPNRLMLLENKANLKGAKLEIPELACRYTSLLSEIEYQVIGINFRGYIIFDEASQSQAYINQTLLNPGPWQQAGTEPVQVGLNLVYNFRGKRLNLSVNPATLKLPETEEKPVLLFTGNFDYDLSDLSTTERQDKLQQSIKNWTTDLDIYQEVVEKFLVSVPETTVIPEPAIVG